MNAQRSPDERGLRVFQGRATASSATKVPTSRTRNFTTRAEAWLAADERTGTPGRFSRRGRHQRPVSPLIAVPSTTDTARRRQDCSVYARRFARHARRGRRLLRPWWTRESRTDHDMERPDLPDEDKRALVVSETAPRGAATPRTLTFGRPHEGARQHRHVWRCTSRDRISSPPLRTREPVCDHYRVFTCVCLQPCSVSRHRGDWLHIGTPGVDHDGSARRIPQATPALAPGEWFRRPRTRERHRLVHFNGMSG